MNAQQLSATLGGGYRVDRPGNMRREGGRQGERGGEGEKRESLKRGRKVSRSHPGAFLFVGMRAG
jgi:hypothetical protein